MSNLEGQPQPRDCPVVVAGDRPAAVTLLPREVPLGGPRAMKVRRTLPHRDVRTVGAWCFIDDFGPIGSTDAEMAVPPHPHVGLQTITWLLAGIVEHRDSTGGHSLVQPGELNIMTAGRGVAHSEDQVSDGVLRGVQTWVALPGEHRDTEPAFAHHDDLPVVALPAEGAAVRATVAAGSFAGATSPAQVFSPLVGVELRADGPARMELALDRAFEHGLLALDDSLLVDGEVVPPGGLRYLGPGTRSVVVEFGAPGPHLLIGGEPLGEDLLMWWNFVGRDHDDIARARQRWEAGGFPAVVGDPRPRLPAPALPNGTLKPRPSRPPVA